MLKLSVIFSKGKDPFVFNAVMFDIEERFCFDVFVHIIILKRLVVKLCLAVCKFTLH